MVTLATLPQATAREVFDQVKAHLLKQNQTCIANDICVYKHENLKCAAGCLISDEEYSNDFEGNMWSELVEQKLVPDNHSELIERLQAIHDNEFVYQWEYELNQLEKELAI